MKVSKSKERIKELMEMYGLSQADLCRRTGIQKSALSNYLSGTREPRQDQLSLIADPFGINPAWLMGYDVPMRLNDVSHITPLSEDEAAMLSNYRNSTEEKKEIIRRILAYGKE